MANGEWRMAYDKISSLLFGFGAEQPGQSFLRRRGRRRSGLWRGRFGRAFQDGREQARLFGGWSGFGLRRWRRRRGRGGALCAAHRPAEEDKEHAQQERAVVVVFVRRKNGGKEDEQGDEPDEDQKIAEAVFEVHAVFGLTPTPVPSPPPPPPPRPPPLGRGGVGGGGGGGCGGGGGGVGRFTWLSQPACEFARA